MRCDSQGAIQESNFHLVPDAEDLGRQDTIGLFSVDLWPDNLDKEGPPP
jgi:hypothetical protein